VIIILKTSIFILILNDKGLIFIYGVTSNVDFRDQEDNANHMVKLNCHK